MGIVYSTEVTVQVPDPIVVRYSLVAKKEDRNQKSDFFCKTDFFCTNLHVWYFFRNSTFFEIFNFSLLL